MLQLVNFIPYHFKVTAISKLGYFSNYARSRLQVYSAPTAAITPWVRRPLPPINGRGAPGNKRAFLQWDAPPWDGGRVISQYLLQVEILKPRP